MPNNIKVALQVPHPLRKDLFFSCTIKNVLPTEPSKYNPVEKIAVLSEVGNNFQNLCKILSKNKVIDKYLNWIFDDGHLVIIGNCTDCSGDAIDCLWFLYSLEDKARKNGGYIHLILSTIELKNLNNTLRISHPKYASNDLLPTKLSTILYDGNNHLLSWILTKNFFEKIGNTLFSYGVLNDNTFGNETSFSKINSIIRHHCITNSSLLSSAQPHPQQSTSSLSIYKESEISDGNIEFTKQTFDAQLIILGCISSQRIKYMFNNRIIGVNIQRDDQKKESLSIYNGKFYRVDRKGVTKELELQ